MQIPLAFDERHFYQILEQFCINLLIYYIVYLIEYCFVVPLENLKFSFTSEILNSKLVISKRKHCKCHYFIKSFNIHTVTTTLNRNVDENKYILYIIYNICIVILFIVLFILSILSFPV